jgi:predicted N-acetyltransferase YhbS
MEIRAAQPQDAGRLSAIAFAAKAHWGYEPMVLEGWRTELTVSASDVQAYPTYIAVSNGEIVGFYMLKRGLSQWILEHVWIDPPSMNQGTGMQLVRHALEQAAQGGARSVVVASDPNAAGFYERAGGTRCGSTPAPIPGAPGRTLPLYQFMVHVAAP